jgi:DNA-binding Lrp family transcriptional regulator
MDKLSELDKNLLNDFQRDFPLNATPYKDVAEKLGTDEATVIKRLTEMKESGLISRVGPVFKVNGVGVSTLAAMTVPEKRLLDVAGLISSYDEVNHNYEREHHFNLWFVLTATTTEKLDEVIEDIEYQTGLQVMKLPMLDDYHIDLGFRLKWN